MNPKKTSTQSHAQPASAYWLPLTLVLIAVFALFFPIHNFDYSIIDDSNNVYSNRFICHIGAQDISHLWRHAYYELYMPVTDTIWALLARIAPLKSPITVIKGSEPTVVNPAVFHVASLLFHTLTTALIFGILSRLRFKPWACAAGALFFSANPLQVESVAWITGMNNLISGFFGFFAVYVYLLAIPQDGTNAAPVLRRRLLLVLSTFLFATALLSKPISTILPLFLIIFETVVYRRSMRLWAKTVGVWLLLAIVCTLITRAASGTDSSGTYSPLWARPFIAGDSLAFYVAKLAYPADVTFDYMRNPYSVVHNWWGYFTWILPVALACILWIDWPKRRFNLAVAPSPFIESLRVGFLVFVAGVLPTIGLVPYYSESISSVSDRFLYLAMLGPAIAVAAFFSRPLPERRILMAIPIALLAALVYRSVLAIPIWANMYSLTNDMLDSTPNSPMAHQSYGILLSQRADWEGALAEFKTAERLNPGISSSTDDSIGLSLYHLQRYDEAIAHYKESIRLQPDDNDGWFQLWLIWSRRNRLTEAEDYMRARIAKYPDDDRAKFTLGLVLMQQDRPADALPYIELAAKSDPENSESQYYVGVIYQKLGRFTDAAASYQKALEIDPHNADATKGLASLPRQMSAP